MAHAMGKRKAKPGTIPAPATNSFVPTWSVSRRADGTAARWTHLGKWCDYNVNPLLECAVLLSQEAVNSRHCFAPKTGRLGGGDGRTPKSKGNAYPHHR